MIQKLQALKARKGFTMIELIVVIAIIGVLSAIIFPILTSDRSKKREANVTARDFYTAVQSAMSKYSLYDGPLSPEYEANPTLGEMYYYNKMNGNYPYVAGTTVTDAPQTTALYVEFVVKKNVVTDVYTCAVGGTDTTTGVGLYNVAKKDAANRNTVFGSLLKSELEKRISYQDGFYYAKISYKNILTSTIPQKMEAETVKVEYTAFSRRELPLATASFTAYKNSNMYFGEDNVLNNGEIMGVCAPFRESIGTAIGQIGTTLD